MRFDIVIEMENEIDQLKVDDGKIVSNHMQFKFMIKIVNLLLRVFIFNN